MHNSTNATLNVFFIATVKYKTPSPFQLVVLFFKIFRFSIERPPDNVKH